MAKSRNWSRAQNFAKKIFDLKKLEITKFRNCSPVQNFAQI